MRVAALIAAAGSSTRMGMCKALLPIVPEMAFVRRLAEVYLRAGASPIIVTLPEQHQDRVRAQLGGLTVTFTTNDEPKRGLSGSVMAALTHARVAEALIVSPVDCPFVDTGLVQLLVAALRTGVAAVPIIGDMRGHPAVFSRAAFELLWSAADIGGPRAVLAALGEDTVEVPWGDPRILENVDTPEDYQRLFGRPPKTL